LRCRTFGRVDVSGVVIVNQIHIQTKIDGFRDFCRNHVGPENVNVLRIPFVVGEKIEFGFIGEFFGKFGIVVDRHERSKLIPERAGCVDPIQ
jgi:hypothetical protein